MKEMAQTTAAHGAGAPLFHGDSFCFISNFKVMIMMNLLESVDFLISYNAFGGLLLLQENLVFQLRMMLMARFARSLQVDSGDADWITCTVIQHMLIK